MNEDAPNRPASLRVRDLNLLSEEGEEVLSAIRAGEVDALMVHSGEGDRVFTLQGADWTHRALVERMGDGALLLAPDGIIAFCNPAFARLTGLDREAVLAYRFQELVTPESVPALEAALGKAPTEAATCEVELQVRENSSVPVRVAVSPVEGGSLCAIVTDLTPQRRVEAELEAANLRLKKEIDERARLEMELRASEDRFRATFNWAAVGIAHVTRDGRFLQVNDRFSDIVGYPREALQELTFPSITHRDDVEADIRLATRLATGEIPRYHIEKRYVRRNGSVVWVNQTASAVRDDKGALQYLVVVLEDITSRKLTEGEREELLARAEEARAQAEQAQARAEELYALTETARQETEQALHRAELARLAAETSEAVYRGIGESIPFGIWIADARGDIEYLSESFLEVTGKSMDECRGVGWTDCLHPDDVPTAMAAREKCLRDGGSWNCEFRIRGLDGRLHTVLSRGTPIRDPDGRIVHWAGINLDITAEKEVEEALRESEERFRTMADGLPFMVWVHDAQGRQQFVNQTFCEFFGISQQQMTANTWRALVHPDDDDAYAREFLACVRDRRPFHAEARVRRADGEWRWIESFGRPRFSPSGEFLGFVGSSPDITDRKRAEEELRQALARLDAHIANSPLGVVEFDPQFRVTRWSEGCERLFGWSASEVEGRAVSELPWVHDEDVPAVRQISQDLITGCRSRNVSANRNYRKDGSVVYCVWYNSALYDAQGRMTSILSLVLDVTERKKAEDELVALNEDLERRVAERTAELERSHEAMRQVERLALLGQMMAVISHESRNALQRSQVALQMLTRRFKDVPEAQRLVGEALQAQRDVQRVHDEVRDYVAPLVVEPVPCSLNDAWRAAWKNLAAAREGRTARLHERILTSDLACEGDPLRIRQAFRNIFENAIAACADPVEVEIFCTDADIDGRPALRIGIRDNGPGLSPEVKNRIFEPFFTTKAKGTGLGMTIVKRIIDSHGGTIELGEADAGFELVILLPRQVLQ